MFDFDVRSGNDTPTPEMLAGLSGLQALRASFNEPVMRVPRRPPLLVSPLSPLNEALTLMAARHAAAAVVASHGVLLGLLDERALVHRLLSAGSPGATTAVWKVMAADPETLSEDDTVAYAVRKLWTMGGRAMPIMRAAGSGRSAGTLVGLIETQDIVAWLVEKMGATAQSPPGNG